MSRILLIDAADELRKKLRPLSFPDPGHPQRTGEEGPAESLAAAIRDQHGWPVTTPEYGETVKVS